ncbi:MAG: type II toxin-antitoxin system prevent-host-death family antitoxin [Burkholderiales bacterium]|nr:type II toxin-antitoxin system prevent-host-death family antitoxin [Burkholderiales bacterium]
MQTSKSDFKARALEYLRRVEATGESVIVTDHGEPRVEVRPYRPDRLHPLQRLQGSVLKYDDPLAPVAEDEWTA